MQAGSQALLRLDPPIEGPFKRMLFSMLKPSLSRFLCLSKLNAIYDELPKGDTDIFLEDSLTRLGISVNLSFEDASRIPAEGPVLVVANHPYGAVEGVVLGHMLRSVRPDSKLMANYLLSHIPEMRDIIINVDPFGSETARKKNIGPLKESIRWLKAGHCLGVFPSGEVSSLDLRRRTVADPPWSPTIGRIARSTEASVLPVFFAGRNSLLFQLMGLIHPRLRTALLPREMLRRRQSVIDVRVGSLIPASKLAKFDSDQRAVDYLRTRTYVLKHRVKGGGGVQVPAAIGATPVAAPEDPAKVEAEIAALPAGNVLFENKEYTLFIGRREQLTATVLELGRLREETFREVGEGTGAERDLDRFDDYYHHLCLGHRRDREIAGAYRIGPTDEILPVYGRRGLYTDTLFKYKKGFLDQITPALELGRSFVRRKYQKSYFPLLTLWKGIALYAAENPQYRFLFGPVSISNSYTPFSRSLLVKFLNSHSESGMGKKVKPKIPPKIKTRKPNWKDLSNFCQSIEDLGSFISEVEGDAKGVPVLLRQYLKLGGKIMAFNVDPAFMNALDGLILVDLTQTDPKLLAKYMGSEGARRFLEYHATLETD